MRGQRRFSVSMPHVGLARIVNEHPQEFYQTGFWNPKYGPHPTFSGIDLFRLNDGGAFTVRCFSVVG